MSICLVIQSRRFKCGQRWCVWKRLFNGEIINLKSKNTEKVVLLQVKGLIKVIVKLKADNIFLHVCTMHKISFWGAQNIALENKDSEYPKNKKRKKNESLHFPEG